ncbi:hypothetical protein CONLIGDRAFT_64738 [Coniochaeta ligniaria NRRL 30616]|uniref:Uncharacterized protein n=1 Tax=Coniochaeta ligniaria NRRL 30616 TaxID=1408157 RepID=A0A1J7J647_9PEZI|nr:hypothetical protein CONLIGDRAFT_64738 [Coniochaeta ligniaria NRRL 30616]
MCGRLLQAPTLVPLAPGRRESAGHRRRRLKKTEDELAPVTEASGPRLQPAVVPQQPGDLSHIPWPTRQGPRTSRARVVIFPSGTFRPQSHFNPQDSIWQSNYQRHAPMMAEPLGLNPPSAPNQQSFQNYMPPQVFGIPQHGHQDQSASTGGSGVPSGHPPQPFPGPSGMMGLPYGSGPDGFGYNPQGGNQNNQTNNNRMDPFSFPNTQNNNQGNAIPNREDNW